MAAALATTLAVPGFSGPDLSSKPHLVTLIADDLGWDNVGWHRKSSEVVTPNLDGLLRDGVELERHYVYKFCSPSRSAFQTGRLPVHVNTENAEPTVFNPKDPVGGFAGIPINMTGIAQKLRSAGYRAHMTGKWDAGMATPRHTPLGRGYESWLGYFHHSNDYWSEHLSVPATGTVDVCQNQFVDLWDSTKPAWAANGTGYEEELFVNHTLATIAAHDVAAAPLFLVHAFHLAHTPLQVPKAWEDKFAAIDYEGRRLYAAMASYMDAAVGQIVAALRAKAMWGRTLLLFFADNGGPIYYPGSANNSPLKGGKLSDWEGGVRSASLLAGGALPPRARGTALDALLSVADWYPTFCGLAGCDGTSDAEAAAAGLPPPDGIDMWPLLLRGAASPPPAGARAEVHLSAQALLRRGEDGELYKLVTGWQIGSGWTGDSYPNATGNQPLPAPIGAEGKWPLRRLTWSYDCGQGSGCLFDVAADPTEHVDLAARLPSVLGNLSARLAELNRHNYDPDRGQGDERACAAAADHYRGFYGPWIGV